MYRKQPEGCVLNAKSPKAANPRIIPSLPPVPHLQKECKAKETFNVSHFQDFKLSLECAEN